MVLSGEKTDGTVTWMVKRSIKRIGELMEGGSKGGPKNADLKFNYAVSCSKCKSTKCLHVCLDTWTCLKCGELFVWHSSHF